MIEVIPSEKVAVIPWPPGENLLILKRTSGEVLVMGLTEYLKDIRRQRRHVSVGECAVGNPKAPGRRRLWGRP